MKYLRNAWPAQNRQTPAPPARIVDQPVAEAGVDFSYLLYMLSSNLDEQIRLADSKANLVLGANAILLTVTELKQGALRSLVTGAISPTLDNAMLLFSLGTLAALLVSVVYAVRTSIPNLGAGTSVQNLFFFDHIQQLPAREFVERFMAQNGQDIKRHVLEQVHARSRIASVKFRRLRISMIALLAGAGCWVLSQLAHALSG